MRPVDDDVAAKASAPAMRPREATAAALEERLERELLREMGRRGAESTVSTPSMQVVLVLAPESAMDISSTQLPRASSESTAAADRRYSDVEE